MSEVGGPGAATPPSSSSATDSELALRVELLRCRKELDAVCRELGVSELSGFGAARRGISVLVESAVADSRELERLKSSLRYRLALWIADMSQKPLRISRQIMRSAKRAVRKLRGASLASVGGQPEDLAEEPTPALGNEPSAPIKAPASPTSAADLTMAAVLDPFSAASFAPECRLILLDPVSWPEQLRGVAPHILLVESAWTGVSGEWRRGVERAAEPLRELVAAFRNAGIPTVFWNKEDPLHFGAFLDTAALFDHVLTTDADCIPRYRRLLGHDRVGVMPFGIQPSVHHPVCSGPRRRSSVFAGAWYGRLPDRARDFVTAADALALAGELVIHDRLNGEGEPHQQFPSRYRPMLRPAIPYERTGEVFRQYVIGLNLNTIKSSPTMFARRALELAACGTSVYGNHSVGLQLVLGDSVVATDDSERLLSLAWSELREPHARAHRMRRLRALRAVMSGHTWGERVRQLGRMTLGVELGGSTASIVVVARVGTLAELDSICASFERQLLPGVRLVLDAPCDLDLPSNATRLDSFAASDTDWIAMFHVDDYYGPHYLVDLLHATMWGLGDLVGKGAWHRLSGKRVIEINGSDEYRKVESLALRRAMFRRNSVDAPLDILLSEVDSGLISGVPGVSTDAWEYVEGGGCSELARSVDVRCAPVVRTADIVRAGTAQPAQPDPEHAARVLSGSDLVRIFGGGDCELISFSAKRGRMELCSTLKPSQKATLSSDPLPRHIVETSERLQLCLQGMTSTSTKFRLDVIGARGQVIRAIPLAPLTPIDEAPPQDVRAYRLTVEVRGPAVQEIDGVWIGTNPVQPLFAPGGGRLALVSNGYPQYDALYRNAFLHRRVVAYTERGIGVDVFVVKRGAPLRNYEYEGVLVRECHPETLAATLAKSGHAAVAVHFMDADIWRAVRNVDAQTPVVVWVHGAEVQSWRHRVVNHPAGSELEVAKYRSIRRAAFWKELFTERGRKLKFVFVSEYLANQTWADLGVRARDGDWVVIHNPVDSDLFSYQQKSPAMAKHVLSIRPHASKIYANDLVAEAIHCLAGEEIFSELRFTLVGDGPLWEDNFLGLEKYPNVSLVRGFVSQEEISSLHKTHGVFLVPSRGDTQGVSRDEAMSSGLVPVTTRAGAIPEFVDASCAEVCDVDDAPALAAAVLRLVNDPERFAAMSERASRRVAEQSGSRQIVDNELQVLGFSAETEGACCLPESQ